MSDADMTNTGRHPRQMEALWGDLCALRRAAREFLAQLDKDTVLPGYLKSFMGQELAALRAEAAKS